jgi:hypothetical protein
MKQRLRPREETSMGLKEEIGEVASVVQGVIKGSQTIGQEVSTLRGDMVRGIEDLNRVKFEVRDLVRRLDVAEGRAPARPARNESSPLERLERELIAFALAEAGARLGVIP